MLWELESEVESLVLGICKGGTFCLATFSNVLYRGCSILISVGQESQYPRESRTSHSQKGNLPQPIKNLVRILSTETLSTLVKENKASPTLFVELLLF